MKTPLQTEFCFCSLFQKLSKSTKVSPMSVNKHRNGKFYADKLWKKNRREKT